MKPRSLLHSLILVGGVALLANELATGIINTFSFDIFEKCVTGEYELTDTICQNGPQVLTNITAAVLFVLMGWFVIRTIAGNRISRMHVIIMGVLLGLGLSAVWQIDLSLRDNFAFTAGPETLTEYLYVAFFWLRPALVALIVGFTAWIPAAVNRSALERKEPRLTFEK